MYTIEHITQHDHFSNNGTILKIELTVLLADDEAHNKLNHEDNFFFNFLSKTLSFHYMIHAL